MSLDITLSTEVDTGGDELTYVMLADKNITHNLAEMARELGVYKQVWRGNGIDKAGDLVPFIEKAIMQMKEKPEYFKQFSADNGWGTYEQFLPWLEELLIDCKAHPKADISFSY